MKVVFENKYVIAKVDKENSLYYYEWTTNTESLENPAYLKIVDVLLQKFVESQCVKGVANALKLRFIIEPYIQIKVGMKVFEVINKQVKKFAHVIPDSFYSSLSHEQIWEDNTEKTYEEKYFISLEEAMKWIQED